MSDLVTIEQKQVEFYGDELTAVLVQSEEGERVYVPVRPLCEFLGLDWSSQRRRINRDPVLSEVAQGVVITTTPSPDGRGGGPQEMTCLPLEYLQGWLFGVNAARVKDELRERLIRYQRDCYRILAAAFLERAAGTAVTPQGAALLQLREMVVQVIDGMIAIERRQAGTEDKLERALNRAALVFGELRQRVTAVERQLQAGALTEEQAREIQYRVNLIAEALTRHKPGEKHHMGVYEALRHETGATSYKSISPKGYEAAVAFLDNWLKAIQEAADK